jgi:hypothetical protein
MEISIWTFLFKLKSFFHRRAAKGAEDRFCMFAVERTANIKINEPQTKKILLQDDVNIILDPNDRRSCFFNFLASQQKVKNKNSWRSQRLERSGR